LESADLRIVNYVINLIPIKQIFGGAQPTPLSQGVLLSLMQQLSMDLQPKDDDGEDVYELKFAWMEECMMALNPRDPLIELHLRKIIPGLISRLEAVQSVCAANDPLLCRQIKIMLHVARSLQ
jgi:enhancer of mRNA-decapping protein 4